jgi:glycosyltransferase involved in cell wall biosynthesis
MKKLLYLSNSIIPSRYANSVHVMKMCQAFQNNGFDVELLCYTSQRKINEEIYEEYGISNNFKITAYYLKIFRAKFFQFFFSILKLLMKQKTNTIVYGRDIYSLYLASLLGFDVYYESHSLPTSKLHAFVEKRVFASKYFRRMTVISDKLKNMYLNSNFRVANDKIITLHDGADEIDLTKGKNGLGSGFHIGYIGSLYYDGRGIDLILKVAKLNPGFIFHLVGGKDEEVRHWKNISSSNVRFYGYLHHKKATQYLLNFDVVLMAYQSDLKLEGLNLNTTEWMSPMKMFEYMSAQKAIVSSNFPVIKEVLNNKNSMLVVSDDIDAWSRAINSLYDNSAFAEEISSNAYNDFINNYTWNKRAKSIKLINNW